MGDLKGGNERGDFFASMGLAIEQELNNLLQGAGKERLPTADTEEARDRRRLFAAIARGVIRHMRENDDAFRVVFDNVASPHSTSQFRAHIDIRADV